QAYVITAGHKTRASHRCAAPSKSASACQIGKAQLANATHARVASQAAALMLTRLGPLLSDRRQSPPGNLSPVRKALPCTGHAEWGSIGSSGNGIPASPNTSRKADNPFRAAGKPASTE